MKITSFYPRVIKPLFTKSLSVWRGRYYIPANKLGSFSNPNAGDLLEQHQTTLEITNILWDEEPVLHFVSYDALQTLDPALSLLFSCFLPPLVFLCCASVKINSHPAVMSWHLARSKSTPPRRAQTYRHSKALCDVSCLGELRRFATLWGTKWFCKAKIQEENVHTNTIWVEGQPGHLCEHCQTKWKPDQLRH